MKQMIISIGFLCIWICSGCRSTKAQGSDSDRKAQKAPKSIFLPSEETISHSRWSSYDDVKADFEKIELNKTTIADLDALGFSPASTANVKILTYLDVITRFMPNQSMTRKDLPEGISYCLDQGDRCKAYELNLTHSENDRYGNVMLDVLGFQNNTNYQGWNFKAVIVIRDDTVVYKISSGQPKIVRKKKSRNPLGPLQKVNLGGAVKSLF